MNILRSAIAAVLLATALSGCQSSTPQPVTDAGLVTRCTEQSGFTARAAALRASGTTGRIDTTPEELAAVNACVNGGTAAPSLPAALQRQSGLAASCLLEVDAPGSYVTRGVSGVPTVKPGGGGTQQGADAINACIRRKAGAGGVQPAQSTRPATIETQLPDVAGVPQRVSTQTDGATVRQTYTYGTPPAAAARASTTEVQTRQCNLQMYGGTGYRCSYGY